MTLHEVWGVLIQLQRKRFCGRLEVAYGLRHVQLEIDAQMSGGLCRIGIRPQRDREVGLEVFDRDRFVIFDLEPLRAKGGNRHYARTENGSALCFLGASFAHLQKAGIDRLLLELVIELLSALAFENDGRQAHGTIPSSEVGDRRMARQGENVVPFFYMARVIGKNLPYENPSIPIVDASGDFHLFE